MTDKDSAQDVIDSYRKKQSRAQRAPKLLLGIAALLLIVGATFLIFWLTGDGVPSFSLSSIPFFASDTPVPTFTQTASPVPPTPTSTLTPTIIPPTNTLEPSLTPTRSGPVIYTAEEGDNFFSIAEEFGVDILVLLVENRDRLNLDLSNPIIRVGDEIYIPAPNTVLPSATPLPEGLPRGTVIEYMVVTGDSLEFIAIKFNSTVEDILDQNEDLEDPNAIYIGQNLIIRINLVTPQPTEISTDSPPSTPGTIATLTPAPLDTPEDTPEN